VNGKNISTADRIVVSLSGPPVPIGQKKKGKTTKVKGSGGLEESAEFIRAGGRGGVTQEEWRKKKKERGNYFNIGRATT